MAQDKIALEINIKGDFKSKLDDLTSSFASLDKYIKSFQTSFGALGSSLSGVKIPSDIQDNIQNVAESLNKLSSIRLPNVDSFVRGLQSLKDINIQETTEHLQRIADPSFAQSLQQFAGAVAVLGSVKAPNFSSFAEGIDALSRVDVSGAIAKLSAVPDALRSFENIKVPNVEQLARGLTTLSIVDMSGFAGKLEGVPEALRSLENIKVPNVFNLAKGLERLIGVDIQRFIAHVKELPAALQAFSSIKAPNINSLAKGLELLQKIDVAATLDKFRMLRAALSGFEDLKVPNVSIFANGIKKLMDVDVGAFTKKLQELKDALNKLDTNSRNSFFATLAAQIMAAAKALDLLSKSNSTAAPTFGTISTASDRAAESFRLLHARMQSFMRYRIVSTFINDLTNALYGIPLSIREFDQALKDLQAISGATTTEVAQMREEIKKVAQETKFSANEIAQGMITIAQAGFSAAEAIKMIGPIAQLATGTLSSMADTVELVTSAMVVFNIAAKDTAMITDVFANAMNKSKLDVDKLKTAFNYIGPVAVDANMSLNETAGAMMVLANSGQRASTIGTGLRNVLSTILSPTDKLKEAAEKVGVSVQELDPRVNSFKDVIASLKMVVTDAQVALDVFGKRGSTAVLSLVRNPEEFQEMVATTRDVGSAAKMAAIQAEGLGVKWKNLRDRAEILAITLGEGGVAGAMGRTVDFLRSLVTALTSFAGTTVGKTIISVATLATAIGTLSAAIAGIRVVIAHSAIVSIGTAAFGSASLVGKLTAAVKALSVALNTSPLVVATVAVAALSAAIYAATSIFKGYGKAIEEASLAAAGFAHASNQIVSFRESITGVGEGTEVYRKSLVQLVTSLKESVKETKGAETEFRRFLATVDLSNGKLIDSGAALEQLNTKLHSLEFSELAKNLQNAKKEAESTASALKRVWNENLDANFREFKVPEDFKELVSVPTELAKGLNRGEKGFKDLEQWYKNLTTPAEDLSRVQKELIRLYHVQNSAAEAFLQKALAMGSIRLDGAVDDITKMGAQFGLTKEQLDAVIVNFKEMHKTFLDSQFSSGKEWSTQLEQMGSVSAMYSQLEQNIKLLEAAGMSFTEQERAKIKAFEEEKVSIAENRTALHERYKAEVEAANGNLVLLDDINTRKESSEKELSAKVQDLRKRTFDDEKAYAVKRMQDIQTLRDKQIQAATQTYANDVNAQKRAIDAAIEQYEVGVKSIVRNSYNTEETFSKMKEEFERQQKELELVKEESLARIADLEERGILSSKQAEERRFAETVGYLNKVRAAAVKYNKAIQVEPDSSPYKEFAAKIIEYDKLIAQETGKSSKRRLDIEKAARKEALSNFKEGVQTQIAEYNRAMEEQLHIIAQGEANGTLLQEDAERQRYETTVAFLEKRKQLLESSYDSLAASPFVDAKALADYVQEIERVEAEITSVRRKSLVDQLNAARTANEKLAELTGSYTSVKEREERDYSKKLKGLWEERAKDAEKIEEDKNEKLKDLYDDLDSYRKDLEKDRAAREKEIASSILDLEDELNEKIRGVRQRGMSDEKKYKDDLKNAHKDYAEAVKLIDAGIKENDAFAISRAESKLKSASSVFENIKNEDEAISNLRAAYKKLQEAQTASNQIKDQEAAQEYAEKLNEAAQKRTAIEQEYQARLKAREAEYVKALAAEQERHNLSMANLDKEISKWQEKLRVAKEFIAALQEANAEEAAPRKERNPVEDSKRTVPVDTSAVEATRDAMQQLEDQTNTAKVALESLKESINSITQNVAGMQLVPEDASAQIASIKEQFAELFNASVDVSPLQRAQDILTTYSGMLEAGTINAGELKEAIAGVESTVRSLGNYKVDFGMDGTLQIVKDTGEAVEGLSTQIKSNPLELGLDDKKVINSLQNIRGVVDAVKENVKKPVEIKADTKQIEKAAENLEEIAENKDAKVEVQVKGSQEVAAVKNIIDSIVNSIISVTVKLFGVDALLDLKHTIDSLKDKTVTITTKQVTVGGATKYATGGSVFKRLTDRFISTGSGTKDDVPALLMRDEFVHRAAAVRKYGKDFMYKLNNLQIPETVTRMFSSGGFAGDSPGIIRTISDSIYRFAKGGLVPSAKKRLEELFSGSGVNINVGNLNINDKLEHATKHVSTQFGAEAIEAMSQNVSRSISSFASGGSIVGDVLTSGQLNKMASSYNAAISEARASGNAEIAKALAEEQAKLLELAQELKEILAELEKEYKEEVKEMKEEHDKKMLEEKENYEEDIRKEKESYAEEVEDDNWSYAREDEDYLESTTERDKNYRETLKEKKEALAKDRITYQQNLASKEDEIRDIKKDIYDFKYQMASDKYPKGSTALQEAPIQDVIEAHAAEVASKYGTEYKYFIKFDDEDDGLDALPTTLAGAAKSTRRTVPIYVGGRLLRTKSPGTVYRRVGSPYDKSYLHDRTFKKTFKPLREGLEVQKYSDYLADQWKTKYELPLQLVELELQELQNESPDQVYDLEVKELTEEYNKAKFEAERDRNKSLSDRAKDILKRDTEHQERMAEYNNSYEEFELEENKAFDKTLAERLETYEASVKSAKEDNEAKVKEVKDSTLETISKIQSSMNEAIGEAQTTSTTTGTGAAPVTSTPEGKTAMDNLSAAMYGMGIDELIRLLSKGLLKFASGGLVPLVKGSKAGVDSVLSLLTPREFVMSEKAVRAFGLDFMDSINNLRVPAFAAGGAVSSMPLREGTIGNIVNKKVHALDITINNTHIGELTGDKVTIESFVNVMKRARAQMG